MLRLVDAIREEDRPLLLAKRNHFIVIRCAEGFPEGAIIRRLHQIRLPASIGPQKKGQPLFRLYSFVSKISDMNQTKGSTVHKGPFGKNRDRG